MALSLPTPESVRAARQRLGLTQAEVARAAGVSQPLIARIERGSVDPRLSTLRSIVDALNRAERKEVLVKDVMITAIVSVKSSDPVGEAIRIMRDKNLSQLPVIQKGLPVGSLSDRAVIHAMGEARDAAALARAPVGEVMGPPFPTLAPGASMEQALAALEDHPALLVMERGRIVGIVSKADLLNLIAK